MSVAPNEIRQRLYEFEANRRTRRSAWLPLIGCEILKENSARIRIPAGRNFETENAAIESWIRRLLKGRDMMMRGLIRAVSRFPGATLNGEKKNAEFWITLMNQTRQRFIASQSSFGRSSFTSLRWSIGNCGAVGFAWL
jgi:hypothetical protein